MNDKDIEIFNNYSNIPENEKNTFLSNMESNVQYFSHFYKCEYDFKWLNVIEDSLKYINNILKDPKVFILNNEEVVQIEKSKKVSVESVIHLSQHSNFVSKIDPITGDVRPSKILNVTREETMNIYENRFIYTLINRTIEFVEKYGVLALEGESAKNNKSLNYNAKTKRNNEYINIKLNIESLEDKTAKNKDKIKKINERILNVRDTLNSFRNSTLYKTLYASHVPEVKSPIKKTNVILKNPNFQRAEYLWGFLENYDKNIKHETKYLKNYSNDADMKDKLDSVFLMNYSILLDEMNSKVKENPDEENENYFKNSIATYLSYDTFIDEEKFIKMVRNEYIHIRKRQEKDFKEIKAIIEHDLCIFDANKKHLRDILDSYNS